MASYRLDRYQRSYDEGEVIFEEGHVGDSVFLISEGEVEVLKESGGIKRVIATHRNGDIVGEMALKGGKNKRTVTSLAVSDVEGWKLPNDTFRTMIDKNDALREKMISSFLRRISESNQKLSDAMNRDDSMVQLSLVLLNLIDSDVWEDDDSLEKLEIQKSQEFLAYRFGASLSVINTLLSLQGENDFNELDPDEREKVFALAKRILDDGVECIEPSFSFDDDPDPELVNSIRMANEHLNELNDDSEILDRSDLQDIMEDRKLIKKALDKHKQRNRDDFIVNLLELYLSEIEREINKRYNNAET